MILATHVQLVADVINWCDPSKVNVRKPQRIWSGKHNISVESDRVRNVDSLLKAFRVKFIERNAAKTMIVYVLELASEQLCLQKMLGPSAIQCTLIPDEQILFSLQKL